MGVVGVGCATSDSHWTCGGSFLGREADVRPGERAKQVVAGERCSLLVGGLSVPGPEHRWAQLQVA
eukprot:8640086-Lingulodinium_polyedra.AAC.1